MKSQKVFSQLFLIISVLLLSTCSDQASRLIRLAERAEAKEEFFKSVELYELAIKKIDLESDGPEKAQYVSDRLAHIFAYQLSNPKAGLHWLEFRRSVVTDPELLINTQKRIIRLAIDYLNDFEKAVSESQGLLSFSLPIEERCQVTLDLGLALFQLRRLDEAFREVGPCLGNIPISPAVAFKLTSLEIDILMAQKKHQLAIDRIIMVKDQFKDIDLDQTLKLSLALAYEEIQDYRSASETLNQLQTDSNYQDKGYLKLRMDRLKLKESQQAGARLRRKK